MRITVGWDDAVADWRGFRPLDGNVTADACVIGLGASGLAAVEALAERGSSVVGVDAGRVAAGAAGRNGGFLIGGPALFLHDAIARWGNAAVELYRATLVELDRLVDLLGPQVVRRVGSIRLAGLPGEPASDDEQRDRDIESADCAAHASALRAHGIGVEAYEGPLGQGLFLPDDAATNPAERAIRLAVECAPKAALHEYTRVMSVEPGRVLTERGEIRVGRVIVAIDGGLAELLPRLNGRVRSARLQMLATAPLPARLPCPVYGRWGYDYAQQTPDGRFFVGGGRDRFVEHEWTPDPAPTHQVQAYIEAVARRMAGRPVEVTARWGASVGFTDDARPVCTEVTDGVVAVGGYNGTGNLVGPVAARAAVALALDGTPPPTWAAS